MYAVAIFALALLSPLPFISPFDYIMQDATAQSSTQNVPLPEFADIVTPSPFGTTPVYKPRTVTPFEIDDFSYAVITGDGNSSTLLSIANITNPNSPSVTSYSNTSSGLGDIFYSHVFTINGSTYVIVSGNAADNIGIINITNPLSPVHLVTTSNGEYPKLDNPRGIITTTIGSFTYALVTSFNGKGIQIINVTDPSKPSPVYYITDDADGYDYPKLNGAWSVTTTTIGSSTYALATAYHDNGVQIINITDPTSPSPVADITNSTEYPMLNGPRALTTVTLDSFTYALVVDFVGNGVQIINITEPNLPLPVANIIHGEEYLTLNGSRGITTVTLGPFTYALVTAFRDNSVQIINITDPASPLPVTSITYDNTYYAKLKGAYGIATTTINSSLYALVASYYTGMQIIGLDHGFISAYTSNQNPKYAKAGDTLIINFNASGTIASHTSQILGLNANATVNGAVYNATVTVPSTLREAYATFMINVTNTQGTNATITESDISLSNVFIDTISPTIKLNGANNTIVYLGDSYTDPNATASDSTYEYDITVKGIGSVNTSQTGVYTLNYTAPKDIAGNLGSTIFRIVNVVDAPSLELVPNLVASPAGTIENGTNDFNSIWATSLVHSFKIGNFTYAGIHSGSGNNPLTIANITDPSSPSPVSVIDNTVDTLFSLSNSAYTVIDGLTYAILTSENYDSVLIINLSNPYDPSLVTYVTIDDANYTELLDPVYVTIVTIDSSTFALVTAYNGDAIKIIDITDPKNPISASAIIDGMDNNTKLDGAFDITTVTIGSSTFALATALIDSSIQIVNITDPYNPISTYAITGSDGNYTTQYDVVGITTVTIGSSTFALVTLSSHNTIKIMDITDPHNPTLASSITDGVGNYALNGAYSSTTVTFGTSTFALVAASKDNGVQIVDITNPYNPTPVSRITDGVGGYTALRGAQSITTTTIDSSIFALVASYDDGIQIISLDPEYISAYTDNQNSKYAKANDTLGIKFTTNDTIASHTGQILGLDASATVNGAVYNATVTVPSIPPMESYVTFTINVTNTRGMSTTINENYISLSNVFVDTISPSIELIGSADYVIPYGTSNPFIPNVTVSDGDPNYIANFTLVKNATVNTTKMGSAYNYTYTAYPDTAGNPGSSTSRIITVMDIGPINGTVNDTPSLEIIANITILPFESTVDAKNYLSSHRYQHIETFKIDNSVYAGTYVNDHLTIINITDPNSINRISALGKPFNDFHDVIDVAYAVIDGLTYMISVSYYTNSLSIVNVSNLHDPYVVTSVTYDPENYTGLNGPSGITTVTIGASTFALVTAPDDVDHGGIQIIDITDFNNLTIASTIIGGEDGYIDLNSATITTVPIYSSTFALAPTYLGNIQIIDITDPYNPAPVSTIIGGEDGYTSIAPDYTRIVTINSSIFAIVYAEYATKIYGIQIIDITDPYHPAPVSYITTVDNFTAQGYPGRFDTVTFGASTFVITPTYFGSVQITDITDPYNPTPASSIVDGEYGYTIDRAQVITAITLDTSTYAFVETAYNGIQIIKLEPKYISAYTSNQNLTYAKQGDTLGIQFTANDAIASHTGQILGLDVSATVNGAVYNATVTVPSIPSIESYVTFNIQVENALGTSATINENYISSNNNIFVDTISPSIELIGSADYVIPYGTSNPFIPNVTVSDGDPNYIANFTLVKNATVNTTKMGSVYNYTYTAYPDTAGNPGSSTSRIITVMDIGPINVTSLDITSNGASNNFANEGKNITVTLVTDNTDFINFTGNLSGKPFTTMTSNSVANFTIAVSSNDTNGKVTFSITAVNYSGNHVTFTNDDLTNKSSFVTIDTVSPSITLNGMSDTIVYLGDSYTDPGAIASDSTYANDIKVMGIGSVNTDLAGIYTLTYTAPEDMAGNLGSTISRTVKVQDVSSLEIIANITVLPFESTVDGRNVFHSNNRQHIETFEIDNSVYSVVYDGYTISITNITDPSSPSRASYIGNPLDNPTSIDDGALVVLDGFTYVAAVSEYGNSLSIINVSNPFNLSLVTSVTYDPENYTGLNGPSGITTVTIGASTFALVTAPDDDDHGGIQIIDITDPYNFTIASTIISGEDGYIDLNSATIIPVPIYSSTFALASTYLGNIQIIDITDPYNPAPVSTIISGEDGYTSLGSEYTRIVTINSSIFAIVYAAYATDIYGFQIIDITDPYHPAPVSYITTADNFTALGYPGRFDTVTFGASTFVLTPTDFASVQITDITDPYNPTPASSIANGEYGYTLDRAQVITTVTLDTSTYAFVGTAYNGIQIIKLEPKYISAYTSNQNLTYAKQGDTLGIQFTANDAIASHTGQILGLDVSATVNGAVYNATVTVPSIPSMESYVTFNIQVENALGTSATINENYISSNNNIFVDTISPSIELIGSADYVIPYGTSNPFIPNVTVSDGDPNYIANFTLVKNATVNTTKMGSVYNYTYTAYPDTVGNPGPSTSRIITVMDIGPINVTSLDITSNGASNNFANEGKNITVTLVTDSTDLVHFTGNLSGKPFTTMTANGVANFTITVSPNDANGKVTFSITAVNYSGNNVTFTNDDLTNKSSFVTIDTVSPAITLNGMSNTIVSLGGSYTDLGAIASDSTYANDIKVMGIGSVNTDLAGIYTLNYTAPEDVAGNLGNTIYRTVNVTDTPSLGIMPNLAISSGSTENGKNGFDSIVKPEKINTFKIGNSIYAGVYSDSFTIVNITDPSYTHLVSVLNTTVNNLYNITDAAYAVIDGLTYAISISQNDNRVVIINVSNPSDPSLVTNITDGANYNLSVPLDIATVKIDSSTFALVAASNDSSVQIIDITNPSKPIPAYTITQGKDNYTKLQGARAITTVTIGTSTFALVLPNNTGVQIINITDPYNPAPTSNITNNMNNYPKLNDPRAITTVTIGTSTFALVTSYHGSTGGVQIIDITDPYNPTPASSITNDENYKKLDFAIDIDTVTLGTSTFALVVSEYGSGVQIVDITDPYAPTAVRDLKDQESDGKNIYDTLRNPTSVVITTIGKLAYALVAAPVENGIQIIKLNPEYISAYTSNQNPKYAKQGDILGINFTVSGPIASHTSQILGLNANVNVNGTAYNATVTVPSIPPMESYATFAIQIVNTNGTSATITENYISSKNNIFVDTISPSIELIGSADHYIMQNASDQLPGVIVSDGDPNYFNSFSLDKSALIDTTKIGSVYNYTYTANSDPAGNPGDSISRIITIGTKPITVTSLSIASTLNNFANEGKNITVTLVTDSDDLGNFTGNLFGKPFTAMTYNGTANFTATVTSNDTNGKVTFLINATNSNGKHVTLTNDDLTNKSSFVTIDTVSPSITLNGMSNTIVSLGGSYTDPGAIASDSTYANDIKVMGIGSVNTDLAGIYTLTYTAPEDMAGNLGNTISRTVKVQDVSPLEIIANITVLPFESTVDGRNVFHSNNRQHIETFEIDNSVYSVVYDGYTISITNITDPSSPSRASYIGTPLDNPTSIDDGALVVLDGFTYVAAVSEYGNSLSIINVSNPFNLSLVTSVTYDPENYTGLNGPSGITTVTIGASTFALVTAPDDDDHGGIQIIDITDPYNFTIASTIISGEDGYIDLNSATIITVPIYSSTFALASTYLGNIQIIDITDPYNPAPVSTIISGEDGYTSLGSEYTRIVTINSSIFAIVYAAYATDIYGFQIIDITDPYHPAPVSYITTADNFTALGYPGRFDTVTFGASTFVLTPTDFASVQITDITDPYNPTPASSIANGEYGYTLDRAQVITAITLDTSTYAFVGTAYNGIQIIKLEPKYISAYTSNQNLTYAKQGDTLGIQFTANDAIASHTGQILGLDVSATVNGAVYNATVTVPSIPSMESYVTFNIQVENALGTSATINENYISSNNNIFVDTISPSIELIGSADYVIPYGTSNPFIPNVTVSDGDPNYIANFTLVKNATVNTTKMGSAYNYTYTAYPDTAGNPGSSTSRIITVMDADPVNITSLDITSNSASNNFANEGKNITVTLVTDNTDFINFTGNLSGKPFTTMTSNSVANFTIAVSSNDTNGKVTFSITAVNYSGNHVTFTNDDLTNKSSFVTIDTVSPSITLNGMSDTIVYLGDSYTDPGAIASDSTYANDIKVMGIGSVNTDLAGIYTLTYTAPEDMAGNLGSTISRTVKVQDVSPLEIIANITVLPFESTVDGRNVFHSNNRQHIETFEIDNSVYSVVYDGYTISITNITDPSSPSRASYIGTPLDNPTYIDDGALVVLDGFTYVAAVSEYGNSLSIINVSNPFNLSLVTSVTYDPENYTGLNGPSGITTVTIGASTFALVTAPDDDDHGGIQIIDITDPYNFTIASTIISGEDGYIDLNSATIIPVPIYSSTFALASTYLGNIQIIDITDPYNPAPVSTIISGEDGYTSLGSEYTRIVTINSSIFAIVYAAYATDIYGFQIIDITDPYHPAPVSYITTADNFTALGYPGRFDTVTFGASTFVLTPTDFASVQITDITDPYNPTPASSIANGEYGYTLDRAQVITTVTLDTSTYAFVGTAYNGIQIIKLEPKYISAYTSNQNLTYAKQGDTLGIQFTANDAIASHTGQILGLDVSATVNGAVYNATVTVPSIPSMESYVTFNIQVENALGTSATINENYISSNNNIFVDTISPSIELIGSADYVIPYGTSNPFIPNVTVSDGDPNYIANFTLVKNATVNTTKMGSVYNYTYTAYPDTVGNPGPSTSRIITVMDIGPINVTSLDITSNGASNNFANEGKNITVTLVTDSTDLVHFTGNLSGKPFTTMTANGVANFTITVSPNDANGKVTFSITAVNYSGNNVTFTNDDLTNKSSFVTIDTVSPAITLNGMSNTIVSLGGSYTDLGAIASDSTYANDIKVMGIGSVNTDLAGIYTLNYTAPEDVAGNLGNTIYRTVNVTDTPSLGIMPNLAISSGSTENGKNGFDSIVKPEKINTFKIGNSIYAGVYSDSFTIVNITDPSYTHLVSVLNTTVNNLYNITDAAYAVIDGLTYAISISQNDNRVVIINVSNPSDPSLVTNITDGANYNLSVPLDIATVKIDSSTFALVAASNDSSVQIIDITNPSKPIPAYTITQGKDNYTKLQGARAITTVTIGTSTFALVLPNNTGVQIINITDPYNPAPTSNITNNMNNYPKLNDPRAITTVTIGTSTFALVTSYHGSTGGVQIIDITDPYNPTPASSITNDENYKKLDFAIDIDTVTLGTSTFALVVSEYGSGVQIVDITDPYAPTAVRDLKDQESDGKNIYDTLRNPTSVVITTIGKLAYALVAAPAENGIQIIKLNPEYISAYTSNQNPKYAKQGDILGINFTVSGPIASHTSQILGLNANVNVNGTAYNATVTVPSIPPMESYATFAIQIVNTNGTSATITENYISSKNNIFVDTISPSIELIGSADHYVPQSTSAQLPGIIVSDGDPNYMGGFTRVVNDTFDTTIIGSVYNFTYTANSDPAGNLGDSISRIVTIRAPQLEIMPNLAISSGSTENGKNGFDSIVKPEKINTFKIGNSIYAGVYSDSFTIVNITDPSYTHLVSVLNTTVNNLYNITDAAYAVIDGLTYAISISQNDNRVVIINVSNPSDPSLVTNITDGANYNLSVPLDIATVKIDSSTFALVAASNDSSVQIIDITNPSKPIPAYTITQGKDNYTKLQGARAITTVTIGTSTFALVLPNNTGVQIVNITDPYNPAPTSNITNNMNNYPKLNDPRAITTVTIGTSTFALVTSYHGSTGGVQIIDITDPYNPTPASSITNDENYKKLDFAIDIDTVTLGTSTFALVVSEYGSGVQIVDITDPYAPTAVRDLKDQESDGKNIYDTLRNPTSVVITTIGKLAYALVAAPAENGIQIINLDPGYISAYTSNQNPKYAKQGDILGINFTVSGPIASHTSQILGLNANVNVNGTAYNATVTVPSIPPMESYATFAIQIVNTNGTSATITENYISSKNNIFVDTISPSIELIGSADYVIPYGTPNSFVPSVTVSDGDPNYMGGFTLAKNATVNTAIIGSVYEYTYTANPDRSGNVGNNVTRTIFVVNNLSSTSCMDPESSYNIIIGTNSSTILNGTAGNDLIYGTEGNDIINGLDGNDCIHGSGGNDTINGGDGNDTIDGGDGSDKINGGDGDDVIQGGYGLDEINGDAGNDNLYGDDGNDTINGGKGNDRIDGGLHDDVIDGGEGSDLIHGNDGSDIINGSSGNDNLYGGESIDMIYGGDNDDAIHGGHGDDTLHGGDGNDVIHGNTNNDMIYGGNGDDIIDGGRQNDIIHGGAGNDRIKGSYGDDEIHGSAGDDDIFGDDNNDQLYGGDGNDRIYGGLHNDDIYGDAGSDLVYGGNDNDTIYGNMGSDVLYGEEGMDMIHGGDDNDVIDGGSQPDKLYGDMGDDLIRGGYSHDEIYGNSGNDVIQGGDGHDNLSGGDGNDVIYGENGMDIINGGTGHDELFGGGNNDTIKGNEGNDYVAGGSGSDTITGNNGNDDIKGESGHDVISGGNGDDILDGGYGIDDMNGDDGDDVLYYQEQDHIDGGPGNNTLIKS